MAQCSGITRSGTRCTAGVSPGAEYCPNHDPARADARRRHAAKAGSSRPNRDVARLKSKVAELYRQVEAGETEARVGAVLAQIANTEIRVLETERKIRDQDDIEERLAELEGQLYGERVRSVKLS